MKWKYINMTISKMTILNANGFAIQLIHFPFSYMQISDAISTPRLDTGTAGTTDIQAGDCHIHDTFM